MPPIGGVYSSYFDVTTSKDLSNYVINQNLFVITTGISSSDSGTSATISASIQNSNTIRISTTNRDVVRSLSGTIYFID